MKIYRETTIQQHMSGIKERKSKEKPITAGWILQAMPLKTNKDDKNIGLVFEIRIKNLIKSTISLTEPP